MYNHLSLLFLLNLLSLLQDFDRIVLDEEVLGVARMFREELVLKSTCDVNLLSKLSIIFKVWRVINNVDRGGVIVLFVL
jgi:hypothetical protein